MTSELLAILHRRAGLALIGLALLLLIPTESASAHPLGNFTINHLAEIRTKPGIVFVHYVLDIAEIPSFQIMRGRSAPDWKRGDAAEWTASETALVQSGLRLTSDGTSRALQPLAAHVTIRPGAGGLPILYWTGDFVANLPTTAAPATVDLEDAVYSDRRIGWRDVIVAPQSEPTHELQSYPSALLGSPRRVTGVGFRMDGRGRASGIVASSEATPITTGASLTRTTALSEMFSRSSRTPLFVLLTMLVAFGLGALHALEPGHGKALLAFTLVGARATAKQACILALSLTFAHTAGVFALGIVLFFATGFVSEQIYPWITLVSGVAIAFIGARSLARFITSRRILAATHAHVHEFTNDHHHAQDDGAGHSHTIPGSQPIDFRAAIVAAMSGGIAPCPAAIVVMLSALRLHQLGYGLVIIFIFSLGLALVLTALGIAVVHGAAWLSHRNAFDRIAAAGPLLSAAVISTIGAVMIGQGFVAQGIAGSAWLVAALVLAAIAGYAYSGHRHRSTVPAA